LSPSDTAELAERERGRLFRVAYRLLGTVADAEDAVQETFLEASAAGDLNALLPLLDPSVVLRADGGGRRAGGTGALMTDGGVVIGVVGVTVAGGPITEIVLVVNPDKLGEARRPSGGA
jgi:hypothetical protein